MCELSQKALEKTIEEVADSTVLALMFPTCRTDKAKSERLRNAFVEFILALSSAYNMEIKEDKTVDEAKQDLYELIDSYIDITKQQAEVLFGGPVEEPNDTPVEHETESVN